MLAADRHASALAAAGIGLLVVEPERGELLEADPVARRILGLGDLPTGTGLAALVAPEDGAAPGDLPHALRDAARQGVALELPLRRPDGSPIVVRLVAAPVDALGPIACVLEDITGRRRAEVELRERKARARAVLDQADEALFVLDPDGTILDVNRRTCDSLGYTREELLRMTLSDVEMDIDTAEARASWPQLQPGRPIRIQGRQRRKDGTEFPVDIRFGVFETGRGRSYLALCRDVTEKVTAAAEVRTARRNLEKILGTARSGIIITRLSDGQIVEVNDAFLGMLGRSREDLVGRTTAQARLYADLGAREQVLEQVARTGTLGRTEVLARHGSGGLRTLVGTAGRIEVGGEACNVGIWDDVTELRRIDAALRESEASLRAIFDDAPIGIALSEPRTKRFLRVNRALSEMLGYTAGELEGRTFTDLSHPGDVEETLELAAALERGERDGGRIEKRYVRKDGSAVWVVVQARIVRDAGGRPLHTVITVEDISRRMEVEEKLRSAQRMEAIGRLAGGVAHDFNNLLGVILSYSEILLEDVAPGDPRRDDVEEVIGAAKRAEGLTRQLLAFSRKQVLELQVVDLGALVRSLSRMLGRLIGEDVALEVAVAEGEHRVRVDRGQTEQVVMNLAVNARDAMPGGGTLRIGVESRRVDGPEADAADVPAGEYVVLTVADTGKGMSAEVLGRIFEPFFTTKPPGKGTGLGLSMVHGIVKQSGGGLAVASREGEGSTFRILLPAATAALAAEAVGPPPSSGRHGKAEERILIVEDEPALRAVLQRVLSAAGYQVESAANAAEALQRIEESAGRFRLLLTDVVMPGMNGRELAERTVARSPKTRVLFMSGYNDEWIEQHGVVGPRLLRKPFAHASLLERVRQALDEGHPRLPVGESDALD